MSRFAGACGLLFLSGTVAGESRFANGKLNFTITMPTPAWSWTEAPDANRVSARTDRGDELVVWASPERKDHLTDSWVRDLLRHAAVQAGIEGARIEAAKIELATAPIHPSYRFSYVRVEKGGRKTYVYGYAAAAGRAYVLQVASPDRQSLALFNAFVSSFRVSDKAAALRGGGTPPRAPGAVVQNIDNPIGRPISPNSETGASPQD